MCVAPNAIPAMVRRKFVGETAQKIVRLSDIYRVPIAVEGDFAEKIDSGPFEINGPDGMQLKLISSTACPRTENGSDGVD
jgi:hypothetical protein